MIKLLSIMAIVLMVMFGCCRNEPTESIGDSFIGELLEGDCDLSWDSDSLSIDTKSINLDGHEFYLLTVSLNKEKLFSIKKVKEEAICDFNYIGSVSVSVKIHGKGFVFEIIPLSNIRDAVNSDIIVKGGMIVLYINQDLQVYLGADSFNYSDRSDL